MNVNALKSALLVCLVASYLPAQVTPPSGAAADIFSSGKPAGTTNSCNGKNFSILSGATSTLCNVTGAGYISEFAIFTNNDATLVTVTMNGEATPGISANVADLMADNYLDGNPGFCNRWICANSNGTNNPGGVIHIPMPFASSMQVTVKNNAGSTITISYDIKYQTGVSDNWPFTRHLYLAVVSASGITGNTVTNMVNVTPGKPGRLVGIGWIYDGFPGSVSPATAPLEGAFSISLDGNSVYVSSGSEDFFGMGWYFNGFGTFGANSGSVTIASPPSADISLTLKSTVTWGAQRFFITDPITFNNSLLMSWTCGNTGAVSFTGTCTMKTSVYYYTQ